MALLSHLKITNFFDTEYNPDGFVFVSSWHNFFVGKIIAYKM